MKQTISLTVLLLMIFLGGVPSRATADDAIAISTSVDFYNRYIWRGLDIASTPSIQPALSVNYAGLELGAWGAYTLSNEASGSDEVDFWLSYGRDLENGVSFSVIATDYYFPNAGIDFFNFNNYDAVYGDGTPDPGAHTVEVGLSVTGPASAPITVSGYVNVHNDAGNNAYIQVDYPVAANGTDLNFFCGAALGSEDNPDYYGTDKFAVINLGVTASRELELSESFSLPLTVGFILNPKAEVGNLLVGFSF